MNKTSLIITSIAAPNTVLKKCALESAARNIDFYVIGDVKSPADFSLDHCNYFDVAAQQKLSFALAKKLPLKHYARKNIGYLLAKNSDVILETDDDNYPKPVFFEDRKQIFEAPLISGKGWLNSYQYFSDEQIWPRGFPLEEIHLFKKENFNEKIELNNCPIQQGLSDENPDVDAIYRLTLKTPIYYKQNFPIALGAGVWCPFNSQNTTWFNEVFALMYLPATASFRMTDIWRSFVAQRILWTCNYNLLYNVANVDQARNEHNLLHDFEDEIAGYLYNKKMCSQLEDLDLKSGKQYMTENLMRCYKLLVNEKYLKPEELNLLELWCDEY